MPVTRKECELLNDWDTFRPSPVKIINNSTHFSNGPVNGYNNIHRPQTRLSRREGENGSSVVDSKTNFMRLVSSESMNNSNNTNANINGNKPNEYSDNVTIASSTSSGRYYQDEDCESVLLTPTNEKEYYVVGKETPKIEKHNLIGNETESVLSAFAVNNLNFEDNGQQKINNNYDRKNSKGI